MGNFNTLRLDNWQKEILNYEGNIALRSGRQVGKSTIISIYAGDFARKHSNKTILVIASVERQAFLLFDKVLGYLEDKAPKMIKMGKDRPTKSKIQLKNGSKIYCLPTGLSGRGIRGYTIDLLIADEAAFIPEEVWSAVTPMIATRTKQGARIVLLSTPFGREGYFARCFRNENFKTWHVSSEECERIDKDFLKAEKERMSKREYAQEYLGEFVDDLVQFFPDQLILKCMRLKRPKVVDKQNLFLGVDIARLGLDESTFEIVQMTKNKRVVQIDNQVTRKTMLNQTTNHIITLDKFYNFDKIFIDDEGIGVGVFDFLIEEEQTRRKTISINNSKRMIDFKDKTKTRIFKEVLYNNLLGLMERGEIEFLDDPEIFQSLKSVQYEYTSDNLGRRHLKIFGNYTHIAEGLIRAAWCVKYKNLNIRIDTIRL